MAYSSLMKALKQLIIAVDLTYMNPEIPAGLRSDIQTLSIKLSNLKVSQLKKISGLSLLFWSLFMPGVVQKLSPLA